MKKRLLPIAMAALMLMALIPLGGVALADTGEYTAQFGAQMDPVDGWGLGEAAATNFNMGEKAVISVDFGETVSFGDGNYIAIETNIPNPFGDIPFQDPGVAQILSFKLDGEEVSVGGVLINAEGMAAIDGSGPGLRLTIANKWNGNITTQPVDPLELGEFNTLEIEFIIHGLEITEFTAQFGAQMDPVDGWGLGEIAATAFTLGSPATIAIDFGETVSFGDGNYIAIETNLQNPYEDVSPFADAGIAEILSFKLDGEEIAIGEVLINAEGMDAIDGSGPGLRLTLTNKWNADITEQPVDPLELGEFNTLEIEFIIYGVGGKPAVVEEGPVELAGGGIAWIGGTFSFSSGHPSPTLEDPSICDWWLFEDQGTEFVFGEPFTVSIEVPDGETVTHEEASYGYILAVDTDFAASATHVAVFIDSIKVDGVDVGFEPANIEIGISDVGGVRVAITNGWAAAAPVSSPMEIGAFTKLEVTLAIVDIEAESPFGAIEQTPEPPPPSVAPITPPPSQTDSGDDSSGLPGWAIAVIIGGAVVVAGAIILIVVKSKKK